MFLITLLLYILIRYGDNNFAGNLENKKSVIEYFLFFYTYSSIIVKQKKKNYINIYYWSKIYLKKPYCKRRNLD